MAPGRKTEGASAWSLGWLSGSAVHFKGALGNEVWEEAGSSGRVKGGVRPCNGLQLVGSMRGSAGCWIRRAAIQRVSEAQCWCSRSGCFAGGEAGRRPCKCTLQPVSSGEGMQECCECWWWGWKKRIKPRNELEGVWHYCEGSKKAEEVWILKNMDGTQVKKGLMNIAEGVWVRTLWSWNCRACFVEDRIQSQG